MEIEDLVDGVSRDIACSFDGTELVTMGDVNGFEYTSPFSLSIWFKTTDVTAYVMSKSGGSPDYKGYFIYLDGDGNLMWALRGYTVSSEMRVLTTKGGYNDGLWHHIVATWDGNASPGAAGATIYIDGVLATTTIVHDNLSVTVLTAYSLNLGSYNDIAAGCYIGVLDDAAIYDKELSPAEVADIYNSGLPDDLSADANLVGYWRMGDGATSPTIPDDSTNSNAGTMTNMDATNFVSGVSLYSWRSLLFDGSNEYVTMGDVLGFEYDEAFSVSCWVKTSANSGYLVSKIDGSVRGWGYHLDSSGGVQFILTNSATVGIQVATSAGGFDDGAWHHIVATYSGNGLASGVTFYVDGSVEAKAAPIDDDLASNTTVNAQALQVNGRTGTTGMLAASIDEAAIYSDVLTPTEVTWLYNGKEPRDLLDGAAPTDLEAWWRMGEIVGDNCQAEISAGDFAPLPQEEDGHEQVLVGGGGSPAVISYYKMRARDDGVPAPGYVTWIAMNAPDFGGTGFPGGTPTPVGSMVVGSAVIADEWEE